MKRLTLLLALVLLPSQALAECAWVLWRETSFMRGQKIETGITPATGFALRSECIEGLRSERDREAATHEQDAVVTRHDDVFGVLHPGGWKLVVKYRCLPDTVDPRGKEER